MGCGGKSGEGGWWCGRRWRRRRRRLAAAAAAAAAAVADGGGEMCGDVGAEMLERLGGEGTRELEGDERAEGVADDDRGLTSQPLSHKGGALLAPEVDGVLDDRLSARAEAQEVDSVDSVRRCERRDGAPPAVVRRAGETVQQHNGRTGASDVVGAVASLSLSLSAAPRSIRESGTAPACSLEGAAGVSRIGSYPDVKYKKKLPRSQFGYAEQAGEAVTQSREETPCETESHAGQESKVPRGHHREQLLSHSNAGSPWTGNSQRRFSFSSGQIAKTAVQKHSRDPVEPGLSC